MDRKIAKELGLRTYISGTTCKHGHIDTERATINCRCLLCKSIQDGTKEAREYKAEYYELNKEYILIQKKEYRRVNKEVIQKNSKKWRQENPDKINAKSAAERAIKLQRMPPWVRKNKEHRKLIKVFYTEAKRITEETGIQQHVDHIVPLQGDLVSGLHVSWNLNVIPAAENLSKSNNFDIC